MVPVSASVVVRVPEAVPPLLPTLNVIAKLDAPSGAEKGALGGVMEIEAGVGTFVLRATVLDVLPALHTMLSVFAPAVVALKMKPYWQVAPAASAPAHVVLATVGSAARSAPLARQVSPVRAPVLVMVTATGTAWFSATVAGKPTDVAVKEPGVLPFPDSVTDRPDATVSVPLAAPTTAGVNVTEMVQLAEGVAQVVVETANPEPGVTVGLSETSPPEFVTVTTFGVLAWPTSTSPNARADVESARMGDGGAASVAGTSDTLVSLGLASGVPAGVSLPPQPAAATIPSKPMQAMRNE